MARAKKQVYTVDKSFSDLSMGSGSYSSLEDTITISSPVVTSSTSIDWSNTKWSSPYTIASTGSSSNIWATTNMSSPLSVNGSIEVTGDDADISFNGVKLGDRLTAIEQQLNILRPNTEVEAEWDELRQLGERYRQLEQEIKEKMEVWRLLQAKSKSIKS
jgi:hypothetical protein